MTDSLMRGVVQSVTARAALALGRSDIAGKTGTTNDAKDAWFNGYQPKLVGIAWMGFDKPKGLGEGEFGGTLSLPIWMSYMRVALNKEKIAPRKEIPMEAVPSGNAGQSQVSPDTPPEELKVDSKVVPPSSNEARQASEIVNQQDAQEASKPKPAAAPEKDPLAPFVFKPTP